MAESYDLRSNIKGKPGSQGTLFQVKDKGLLNPEQRWPKGYTPERSREVDQAVAHVPITYPDHMEDSHEPGEYHEMSRYRPQLLDVVKRSTVPTADLAGLREIHGQAGEGHDATYWPGKRTIGIDMTAGRGQDKALIHELGHHKDLQVDPLPGIEHINRLALEHASKNKPDWQVAPTTSGVIQEANKVRQGVGEAMADNYAVEHYRSPGKIANQKKTPRGAYEDNFDRDELDRHYPGYTDVRPSPYAPGSLGPQFKQEHLPGMDSSWTQAQKERAWFSR